MPRKIDYELKSRSKVIKKDLNKQNAIVDAVRQGKIVKAEILSNTELVAKDPIHQALITKQAEETIKSNLNNSQFLFERAATPGNSFPSINSREAPPPVLTWESS